MEVVLSLRSLRRLLVLGTILLAVGGLCVELSDDVFHFDDPYGLEGFFGLSYEENLPTWYASCVLLSCSLVLAAIASGTRRRGERYVRHWWGLAAAFAYISLDEVAQLHEEMSDWFDLGGVLYFGWVVPAAAFVAVFGISYLGFLRHLPAATRWRFVRAGAVYVGGALGVELALGYWSDLHGVHNLGYGLIDLVEETMELAGASLFLHALLRHAAGDAGSIALVLREEPRPLHAHAGRAGERRTERAA